MLFFPMVFMLLACTSSLLLSFKGNIMKFMAGTASIFKEGLQCVVIIPIFILAIILVVEGVKVLREAELARKQK